MEPTGKGEQATFGFFRPTLLVVLLFACNKVTKESNAFHQFSKDPAPTVSTVKASPPKKKKKKIYLTFDDGPNKGTRKVWHIVQEEQVPVTFFIIGEHVFASTTQHATWDSLKITKSIELCDHSFTHAWHNHYDGFYKHPDSVVTDFKRCHDSLQLDNNIVRTPGRNIWRVDTLTFTDLKKSAIAADSLQHAGFAVIGWDIEWHYDNKKFTLKSTSDQLMQQIDSLFAQNKTKIPEHLVILAHDQVYEDADDSSELHRLIRKLKAREDYELVMASSYPGLKTPQ